MSLDTLLEAAEFLECGGPSKEKTREDIGRDFHAYSKSSPTGYASDGSNDNGFGKFYSSNEDSKDKRRSGGAGTREVHNKLEKNRRAHLKECFDTLKYQVPSIQDKKTSNLTILRGALRYIQILRRKESDFEQEMQKWALEKITLQQRLHNLKGDLNQMNIEVDLDVWVANQDQETASTSTASENGSVLGSDVEQNETPGAKPNQEVFKSVSLAVPSVSMASTSPSIPNVVTQASVARPKLLNAAIMTPVAQPSYRTPVTQILHQTITQRAAMQKLQLLQRHPLQEQQQQKDILNKVTTVQINSGRPTAQLLQSFPQARTQQPLPGGVTVQTKMVPFNAQLTAMSKLTSAISVPISSTPKSLPQTFTIPMSSATTTPTSVVAMVTTSSGYMQPVVTTTNSIASLTATPTVSTPTIRLGVVGNSQINQALTASLMNHGIANHNTNTVMPTNIKQLLNTPGTHLVSTGPQLTAINPMRTSTLGQMLSTVTSVGGVTLAGANHMTGVHPVVSLAHITPGQAHIMSPVSLVSPNVHVSNLSQQQINTMIQQQQPLLKSLNQLPLLQPQFLQAGQVVSPQMVKPLMLVPTSSSQAAQVAVSLSQAKS